MIGFHNEDGVYVDGEHSYSNTISQNIIAKNQGLGIDLFNNANMGISPPVITNLTGETIEGTAGSFQTIEGFFDMEDEGQLPIGSAIADEVGNFVVQKVLVGESDVLAGERPAVMPGGPGNDIERPDTAVLACLPALGQHGGGFEFFVVGHQGVVQHAPHNHTALDGVVSHGIQRSGFLSPADAQHTVGFRRHAVGSHEK